MSSNAFESGERRIIPAVLIYAENRGEWLMIERAGKWNGLGGKFEADESPTQAATREFSEEAGIHVAPERWRWLGQIQFPLFKPAKNQDWWCTIFGVGLSDEERARVQTSCAEGALSWKTKEQALSCSLWEGDKVFIPYLLRGEKFNGTFWYLAGKLDHWSLTVV